MILNWILNKKHRGASDEVVVVIALYWGYYDIYFSDGSLKNDIIGGWWLEINQLIKIMIIEVVDCLGSRLIAFLSFPLPLFSYFSFDVAV